MAEYKFHIILVKDGETLVDEYSQLPEVAVMILGQAIRVYENDKGRGDNR